MVELDPRKIIYGQIDEGNQSHIHFVLIKTWIFRVAYQGGIWRTANLVSLMELFELTFFSKKSGENRSKLSCCSIFKYKK